MKIKSTYICAHKYVGYGIVFEHFFHMTPVFDCLAISKLSKIKVA